MNRSARVMLVVLGTAAFLPAVLAAQQRRRLMLDSLPVDTAVCQGLVITFVGIGSDNEGGNGFSVRLWNPGERPARYDPTRLSAELKSGRRVSFLHGADVAVEVLAGPNAPPGEDRERLRLDITNMPKFRAGPIPPRVTVERFLPLGHSSRVRGDPVSLLPMTLSCGRDRLGRIELAPTQPE